MDTRKLFGAVPEDLAALSDEDIQGLLAQHMEAVDKIAADDKDFLGDLDAMSVIAEMEAGVEEIERIKTELGAREEAASTYEAKRAELAARVKPAETLAAEDADSEGGDDSDSDSGDSSDASDDGDETEASSDDAPSGEVAVDADAALEPVVAAAPRMRRPLPKASKDHQPPESETGNAFVATAGISGFADGHRFASKTEIGEAMMKAQRQITSTPAGFRQNVPIAVMETKLPEDRQLLSANEDPTGFRNWALIEKISSPQAIVAAGGICAPVTPYYEQQLLAVQDRPVRDALAGFNADRGGIVYNPPVGIGAISGSDAIGIVTAAADAEGGTFATKSCLTIECVDAVTVDVDIIYHCVIWSNLTARTFPERVAQINDTVLAGLSRLADGNLLDKIKAGSTNVTQANTNLQGATSSLLGSVLTAAAGYRSRQRMAADASLRAILPAWSRDLLVADIIRSQFMRFDMTEAGLLALLRSYNINASFTLDTPATGTGQVFGTQSAGVLLPFPDEVQWALFAEGSWLYLDGGRLELGIVRDSVLNATNQFEQFGEVFETAAFVGIESLWITTAVCPSGTVAAPLDNSDFCS